MTTASVRRTIQASDEVVFKAVADVEHLPEALPFVLKIEFLTEQKTGVGTRFRETRDMNGKEAVTELEITEYEPHRRVRMVADSHGAIWDTVFTVKAVGEASELEITMDARAQKWLPKLLNPVFKGLFRKGLAKHIDAVKAHCES